MNLVTFNVLAPCYANPSWYYDSTKPLLKTMYRRSRILQFLDSVRESDIIALQEVTDDFEETVDGVKYKREGEFKHYVELLGRTHYAHFVSHERRYWSSYFSSDPTSPYAWISNGNAIFVKKSAFTDVWFIDHPLGDAGNMSAFASAICRTNGRRVVCGSIHLDTDVGGNRNSEWNSVGELLLSLDRRVVDIVLGDFNTNTQAGTLQSDFESFTVSETDKFKNALYKLSVNTGLPIYRPTHPMTSTFNDSTTYEKIDHCVYHNGVSPSSAYYSGLDKYGTADGTFSGVIDNCLWYTYPTDLDEEERTNANFELVGSDHFPVKIRMLFD